VCPADRRLVRVAVDLPVPFKIFELKDMLIAHAGPLSNSTLLASNRSTMSAMPWGCVIVFA
jgi:hypothetical protein